MFLIVVEIKDSKWIKDFEKDIYTSWRNSGVYKFNKNTKKKIYSIDTPPPYVNTPIHIGHATVYSLMDMFARFKRMTGYEVLFPLGLDRNGLPIEVAAEKKFNIKLTETPREKFVEYCEKVLAESSDITTDSFMKLGISFNSFVKGEKAGDVYHTDSKEYRTLTQNTFIDLWNKGLIYEAEYLTNYCPGCRTTLADSEIDRKEKNSFLNYVKFKLNGSKEDLIIATTRPELLCTAAVIIYNPNDKRYKKLKGKTAITPIFNIEIPIIEHVQADPKFGTGLVFMSKSAGDQDAVRFLREMGIDPVSCVGIDGRINEKGGYLKGLKTTDARDKIIKDMKEKGLLEKQEELVHSVPICERSKDEIEFVSMKEFYCKQVEFKDKVKKISEKLNFYDESSRQMLLDWINSVSIDWPISRRRYYGTEIPLWYCENCDYVHVPKKDKYYQPWKQDLGIKTCPKCKGNKFRGEQRVFDTWFDSSISPLYVLMYERDEKFYRANSPCSIRPQGKEIIRTWLYYTLLKCYLLTGKVIFNDVWIHYHVVDDQGTKMSKSKGNVIDPQIIINKYGAEPFRLWIVTEGDITKSDVRCSFDRIEGAQKTLNKLWNVARFISMFPKKDKVKKLIDLDKWIIGELNRLVILSKERYSEYDFHTSIVQIKHFIWETFASHYVELVKARVYNQDKEFSVDEQNSGLYTLYYCMDVLLKLLAPVVPMYSSKLYQEIFGENVHMSEFPVGVKEKELDFSTPELVELNSNIWKLKKDNGLALNKEVSKVVISDKFKCISKDLVKAHKIKNLIYGKFEVKI